MGNGATGGARTSRSERYASVPQKMSARGGEEIAGLHEKAAAWQATHPGHSEVRPEDIRKPGGKAYELQPKELPKEQQGPDRAGAFATGGQIVRDYVSRYGERQLGAILSQAPMVTLQDAAREFGIRGAHSRADLASQITAHVTQGRYSANFAKESAGAAPKAPKATPAESLARAHAAFRAAANGNDAERLAAARALVAADNAAKRAAGKGMSGGKRGGSMQLDRLVPINPGALGRLNVFGALDPYALHDAYGARQTRTVLSHLPMDELKQSAAFVERQHPGSMPRGRLTKAGLVDYITAHTGNDEERLAAARAPVAADNAAKWAAAKGTSSGSKSGRVAADVELTPIARIGARAPNVGAAPRPSYLRALYGDDQLRTALGRYGMSDLRLAAQSEGVTKPARTRDALIEQLYQTVTSRETYQQTLERVRNEET